MSQIRHGNSGVQSNLDIAVNLHNSTTVDCVVPVKWPLFPLSEVSRILHADSALIKLVCPCLEINLHKKSMAFIKLL